MTDEMNPETFDIDAWLSDAHLPEDSADIYKRPDVIAELNKLSARMEAERSAADQSMTGGRALAELQERYDALLEEFGASRATVYVRAIPEARRREMLESHKSKGKADSESDREAVIDQGYAVIAESVIGIQDEGGERQDVDLTVEQVKALEARIGNAQVHHIRQAWQRAQSQAPEVTVDFLSRRSGSSKGDTGD